MPTVADGQFTGGGFKLVRVKGFVVAIGVAIAGLGSPKGSFAGEAPRATRAVGTFDALGQPGSTDHLASGGDTTAERIPLAIAFQNARGTNGVSRSPAELRELVAMLDQAVLSDPDDPAVPEALMFIGDQLRESGSLDESLSYYQRAEAAAIRQDSGFAALALRRQKEVLSTLGRAAAAMEKSRAILQLEESKARAGARGGANVSSLWTDEAQWLAAQYAGAGDTDNAAAMYRLLIETTQPAERQWGYFRDLARTYAKGGRADDAAAAFASARERFRRLAKQQAGRGWMSPRQEVAIEAEFLRGIHRDAVTREYLDDVDGLIARYDDCGDCTLELRYSREFDTLAHIRDLEPSEVHAAVDEIETAIARLEVVEELAGNTSQTRNARVLTGYSTAIDREFATGEPRLGRAAAMLDFLRQRLPDDAAAQRYVASKVATLAAADREGILQNYPGLAGLQGVQRPDGSGE